MRIDQMLNFQGKLFQARDLDSILKSGGVVSFLNPHSYNVVKLINGATAIDYWGIDGLSMVLVLRIFGFVIDRSSFDFTSIADEVFQFISKNRKSIYICGSTEKNVNDFVAVLMKKYPNMNIVGFSNGFFSGIDKSQIINGIAILRPDVVLCGMGAGKQEEFFMELKNSGWSGIGFTCGGFIHQTASASGKYYPDWVDRFNLRFVYRIFDEPRLLARYFFTYPKSIYYLIFDLIRK